MSFLFGCKDNGQPGEIDDIPQELAERYYAPLYYVPDNYILGLNEETMLTTEFSTLQIKLSNATADISYCFNGRSVSNNSIGEFGIDLSGVPIESYGDCCSFNGKDIIGVISYTMGREKDKKEGTISRSFRISGTLYATSTNHSTVSFTSRIFDRELTLSLNNLTANKSKAEFGKEGYPGREIDRISAVRLFVNDTGHTVTIEHEGNNVSKLDIKSNESGRFILPDEEDYPGKSFVLTFDDGKVSRHLYEGSGFQYVDLPLTVKEEPWLFFNYGTINYLINYICTYTITPEIYAKASVPE